MTTDTIPTKELTKEEQEVIERIMKELDKTSDKLVHLNNDIKTITGTFKIKHKK